MDHVIGIFMANTEILQVSTTYAKYGKEWLGNIPDVAAFTNTNTYTSLEWSVGYMR